MLTIVVPIFNCEKTINRCIDSILKQTFDNISIILIDDGSTDNSGKICDQYSQSDKRVSVIHRENKGLVNARKLGAKEAKTDLITFVDGDDWIETDAIEKMIAPYGIDSAIDLVVSGIVMDKKGNSVVRKGTVSAGYYLNDDIEKDIVPNMMYNWKFGEFGIMGSVCGKIYRRDLFSQIVDTIDERITYGEDDALVYTMIPKCKKIWIIDDCIYHYCVESNTMATSFSFDSFLKLSILKEHFVKRFTDYGLWPKLMPEVNQIIWMFLHQALNEIFGLSIGYQFPFEHIRKGSKLILYGAGVIGKNYYNILKGTGYAEVVAWIDKSYTSKQREGLNVYNPDEVDLLDCDCIVICIEAQEIAYEIIGDLVNKKVPKNKIFWQTPKFLYS